MNTVTLRDSNYPLQFKDPETERLFAEAIERQRRQVWAQNTKPMPHDHEVKHFASRRLWCPFCIQREMEEKICHPTIN